MRLQDGYQYLRKRLYENATTVIEITRGGESLGTFESIMARTKFEDVDGTQRRIIMFIIDFIVRGDSGYAPQNGDRILHDGRVFVVRPCGKESWRYDDPYKTMIRIHTREEAQV